MKKFIISVVILILFVLTGCEISESTIKEIEEEYNTEETTIEEIITETTTEVTVHRMRLTAVGDLMMHSYQMDSSYDSKNDTFSFDYEFEKVYNYLQNSDFTVGNLETVFAGKNIGYSDYPCFNSPETFAQAIKNAGFDAVSTSNNHSMDKGENGVIGTIELLDTIGLDHFGTYKSKAESDEIYIKDVNGIKIAFLSWTYGVNGNKIPEDYMIKLIDENIIVSDLKRAKELNPDIIIVMPHIGNEYEETTRDTFRYWIDLMIENGADIVLASHPHVLQSMEMREVKGRSGFVIYSLGNFISSQRDKPRDAGVILNIDIRKTDNEPFEIEKISYIPTWVQWKDTTGNYNIRTLSVYDAIKDYEDKNTFGLRPQDYSRLKEVITHSCEILDGTESNYENVQSEYVFYENYEYK